MSSKRTPVSYATLPMETAHAAAATALVFSEDQGTIQTLQAAAGPLAICLHTSSDPISAFDLLNKWKFEAVIIDLQSKQDASTLLRGVRFSPANKTAVTFVITPTAGHFWRSEAAAATFVLERPLSHDRVFSTFRAAYGLMVRERRRYFRYPLSANAVARTATLPEVPCRLNNVSEGGVAVASYVLLREDPLGLNFELPPVGAFSAHTRVCWRGSHGEIGLEFISLGRKPELQGWLAERLEETLPESVSRLFKAV